MATTQLFREGFRRHPCTVCRIEGPSFRDHRPCEVQQLAHGFLAVHPFVDGNGRTARLLLNVMLMHAHHPPALLLQDWRMGYLQALAHADTGAYTPLANLIGRAVEAGLDRYLEVCAAVPEEAYLSLAALAEISGYDSRHLGWLIRQGRLAGVKRSGRWYGTLAAVERYRADVEAGRFPAGRPRTRPNDND